MNTELFNLYFNYFTASVSQRLKPGWGMKMSVYPFNQGAVIVVSFKKGMANSLDKKQESDNLGSALTKTSLFPQNKIAPVADKTIGTTVVGVVSLTKYVLFKNDSDERWSETAAERDVISIVDKAREKYGKQ